MAGLSTLYLLHYNNYYNRQLLREDTLKDYTDNYLLTPAPDEENPIPGVNFIPNDGVNTTQVVNWSGTHPNYLIVADDEGNILSRWFVISERRLLEGQLELTLHRDTVADFYEDIQDSAMFVEKATPLTLDDPAIYNSESMSFNQIKMDEIPLADETGIPWIVGFVPRDYDKGLIKEKVRTTYSFTSDIKESDKYQTINDYPWYQYEDGTNNYFVPGISPADTWMDVRFYQSTSPFLQSKRWFDMWMTTNKNGVPETRVHYQQHNTGSSYTGSADMQLTDGTWKNSDLSGTNGYVSASYTFPLSNMSSKKGQWQPLAKSLLDSIYATNTSKDDDFWAQDGRIIYIKGEQNYYQVKRVPYQLNIGFAQTVKSSGLWAAPELFNKFSELLERKTSKFELSGTPGNNTFTVHGDYKAYQIKLIPLDLQIEADFSAPDDRPHLVDSPYDMFCIPYPTEGKNLVIKQQGTTLLNKVEGEAGFAIATQLGALLGQAELLGDVMLMPYCPVRNYIVSEGVIDIGASTPRYIYTGKAKSDDDPMTDTKNVNMIIWCTHSEFTIPEDKLKYDLPVGETILEKKIQSETQLVRLCSPNYSGLFEFNAAKNNGIAGFKVDCNYKPYSPYIHIAPDFGGLYGQDWDDSRGLICGGDFSLPQITSAWADYQLNNKNYQQMFDRQISNMELNNSVQREKEAWQIAANVGQAFVQGQSAGNNMGLGLSGVLTGGASGRMMGTSQAALSLVAGLKDRQLNDQLRNEAIDYTKDMFGYQLGNIQALPNGLAKVSAFTANNKIFPFLEIYDCTPTEKRALMNKLKYNGYTIMRIGSLNEFTNPEDENYCYIKGQLIRFPDTLREDFHIANALADELNKGVFIQGYKEPKEEEGEEGEE